MTDRYVNHEAAGLYPLLDDKALSVIVESMRRHGFDPGKPVLRYRGAVLDGRNRLRAAAAAGVTATYLDLPDDCDPYLEAWKHNGARRDLEPDHKAAIYIRTLERSEAWKAEREAALEAANKARSKALTGNQNAAKPAPEKNSPVSRDTALNSAPAARPAFAPPPVAQLVRRPEPARERSIIAKQAGVSPATVARVQALEKKAPEKFEAVLRGEAKANRELREMKRIEQVEKLAEISVGNTPLDSEAGRFPVLLADPPWRYDDNSTDPTRVIENQYPTMPIEDICRLPVGGICTDDAILFLWATSPMLAKAMRVIEAWGFGYKTCVVWDKEKIGMGYFFRQQHELLLVAERGTIPKPPPAARASSVIRACRGDHSAKPTAVYEIIEAMYPELPKVELFCRSPRAGWRAWGNQAGGA